MLKIPFNYSYRNLWVRKSTTLATFIGVALVVFIYAAVMMVAAGLEKTMVGTGSDDNVIILRQASTSELVSTVTRDQVNILRNFSAIAKDKEGQPFIAAEVLVVIALPKKSNDIPANISVRGVGAESLKLRKSIKLLQGRLWEAGKSEIIIGSSVLKNFQGAELGKALRFGAREWTIVGVYEAGGTGFDSEIWGDAELFLQAFKREAYSTVTLRLNSQQDFAEISQLIKADKRLTVDVKREKQFYAEQSEMLATFIKVLGTVITVIFSLGAIIGAMITMYSAIANRTGEIGTLRALGFTRFNILLAFLFEAVFISMSGGLAGLVLASLTSNAKISTTNFNTFSELEFGFALSPEIIVNTLIFAFIMGILGGFLPAVRAARLNIIDALRTR